MGRKKIEVHPGDKYGRLTILKEIEPRIYKNGKKRKFLCQCDCGSEPVEVLLNALRSGDTTSCGCYKKEKTAEMVKKLKRKYNKFEINYNTNIVTGYTSNGEKFYFDEDDLPKVESYCWHINAYGYIATKEKDSGILMHRLVMNCPKDMVVDHIDHCKVNNCKSNLRICTIADNCKNSLVSKNNTSGVTGVYFHKVSNRWRADISVNGNRINLGGYINKADAIRARLEAELCYFGEYSPYYEKLIQNKLNQDV